MSFGPPDDDSGCAARESPRPKAWLTTWQRRYSAELLRILGPYTGGHVEAPDLLQDLLLVVLRADRRPIGDPEAWLRRIAKNLGRAARRKRARRLSLLQRYGLELERSDVPEWRDVSTVIRERLRGLPKLQREVIVLRLLKDYSTRETAELLGRAKGTVKASLHRGLARLRSELEAEPVNVSETRGRELREQPPGSRGGTWVG